MTPPTGAAPPPDLDAAILHRIGIASGRRWWRIYPARHPDPLGWGPGLSRFGPTDGRGFGVVYLGSSFSVAFVETLIRDRGDGRTGPLLVGYAELAALGCVEIANVETLDLVDLYGAGGIKMGVPSDVARARDQYLSRQWSAAFHRHARIDGIHYASRLTGERNVAIYDRALDKLEVVSVGPLTTQSLLLGAVLDEYTVEVV